MAEQLYEVLTRRADGHETIHRVVASTEAAARKAVLESGVPDDQIVEVNRPTVVG